MAKPAEMGNLQPGMALYHEFLMKWRWLWGLPRHGLDMFWRVFRSLAATIYFDVYCRAAWNMSVPTIRKMHVELWDEPLVKTWLERSIWVMHDDLEQPHHHKMMGLVHPCISIVDLLRKPSISWPHGYKFGIDHPEGPVPSSWLSPQKWRRELASW
jgi:hypothetical protein